MNEKKEIKCIYKKANNGKYCSKCFVEKCEREMKKRGLYYGVNQFIQYGEGKQNE
jgi:hypothetical protein